MTISDLEVGQEFLMDGLTVSGKHTKTKCVLIEDRGTNEYVISSQNCLILCDGNDKVYLK